MQKIAEEERLKRFLFMDEIKNVPFPQADDFEKVISLLNIPDESKLDDKKYLSFVLENISERQVTYYLSACMYLNLVTKDKTFSPLGKSIRELSQTRQRIELIRLLISDKVFGTVFITEKVYGVKLEKEEIIEIIKSEFPSYSDELYDRRYQTVKKWLNWIDSNFYKN